MSPPKPIKQKRPARKPRKSAIAKGGVSLIRRLRLSSPTQRYIASASNAFMYAPPTITYGSFRPINKLTLWGRQYGNTYAGDKSACFVMDPSTIVNNGGGGFNVGRNFVRYSLATSATIALNSAAAADVGSLVPTNASNLTSLSQLFRPITASLRVTVRYAMTDPPGKLFAGIVYDTYNNLGGLTYTQIASLANVEDVPLDGSGVAQVQVNYRQMDETDYNFQGTAYSASSTTYKPMMIIVATGWPAAFTFDVEAISHVEMISGVVQGAQADADASDMLDVPPSSLARFMRGAPLRLGRAEIALCNRAAFRGAIAAAPQLLQREAASEAAGGSSGGSGESIAASLREGAAAAANRVVEAARAAGDYVTIDNAGRALDMVGDLAEAYQRAAGAAGAVAVPAGAYILARNLPQLRAGGGA